MEKLRMANYQVLFSGDLAEHAKTEVVRENLARELGLDERKARQLFNGRTVVIRSQLDREEAQAWQDRLARLGAICRIKDLSPRNETKIFDAHKGSSAGMDRTLRDITAAHLECPRCGHMQLDSSHCARCGVDLEQVFKQKRKEDLLIEKKIRELHSRREQREPHRARTSMEHPRAGAAEPQAMRAKREQAAPGKPKNGVLGWFKK